MANLSTPTMDDLKRHLKANWHVDGFKSEPLYSASGDHLTWFFSNEMSHAERVDELLTIYRNRAGDLVGFKIKSVSQLVQHVSTMIGVDDGKISASLLLLSAVGTSPAHEWYYKLSEQVKGRDIDRAMLLSAA